MRLAVHFAWTDKTNFLLTFFVSGYGSFAVSCFFWGDYKPQKWKENKSLPVG